MVVSSDEYAYLFEHISLPDVLIQQWLLIPEFSSEVSKLLSEQGSISDQEVLQIMEGIYSEYDPIQGKGYHIGGASPSDMRRSIRKLYRVLSQKSNQ